MLPHQPRTGLSFCLFQLLWGHHFRDELFRVAGLFDCSFERRLTVNQILETLTD